MQNILFITHTTEVYKSTDNKKTENRIILEMNLNLNYSVSIVEYEKTDV